MDKMMRFDLHDKKNMLLAGLIVLDLLLVVVASLYIISLRNKNFRLKADNSTLMSEKDELYARLKANFPQDEDASSISGKVKDIKGGSLLVETETEPDLPPLPREQWPTALITVTTNSDTEFVRLDYDYDEEGVPTPQETAIGMDDMQIGDNVAISANENIKGKDVFIASKVVKEMFMDPNEGKGDSK